MGGIHESMTYTDYIDPNFEYSEQSNICVNPGVLELELRPAVHAYFWVMPTGSFALGARSMIYTGRPKRLFTCRAPTRRAVERVLHLSFGASLGGFGAQSPPALPMVEGCRPSKWAAFMRA